MTSYDERGVRPERGQYLGFDHVHFWVGNAHQAAAYYICRFGFEPYAYRGLETGSREIMTQVVRQNDVVFAFSSALEPNNEVLSSHLRAHGDGVKEVALRVLDCKGIFEDAINRGAKVIYQLTTTDGCTTATIEAPYEDTWHTFIQRDETFSGIFLPGFEPVTDTDPQVHLFPSPQLRFVDHCVANQPDHEMNRVVDWYIRVLQFHRFWSVDDKQLHTKYSSLRSIVVADYDERVKMPINEPATGLRKSQIQEFVEYYGGPGIQHIALNTDDIIHSISVLRKRGVSFIKIPDTYYEDLRNRLKKQKQAIHIEEDLRQLQQLGILVDFDHQGYLLQIFTKSIQDRPTVFLEIIQRCSNQGFGVGNFKSLFEAIEREQSLRGNL